LSSILESSELVAALLGGVVGSLLTFIGGMWQARGDRKRRRKAVATVLLYELRLAGIAFRELYERDQPSSVFAGPSFQMLEVLRGELLLFRPGTVEAVLVAFGYAFDIRYKAGRLRTGPREAR
jgi:hypothetical protein